MQVNQATEPLYIVKPFSGGGIASLFSTHPPIEERVRRLRQMRVVDDVPAVVEADRDRNDRNAVRGDPVRSRVGRERVPEQEDEGAEKRRQQDRDAHIAPVLPCARPQVRGRLAPLPPEPVDRRRDHEDHQRNLEVEVRQLDAPLAEKRETMLVRVEAQMVAHERGHDPDRAERRDERERERNPCEIRRDTGERRQDRPEEPRRSLADRGVGDREAEQAAAAGGDQADLDRQPVLIEERLVPELTDVFGRRPAVRALERADDDLAGGDEQEGERVREEREHAEPGKRETPPAGTCVRPECACSFSLRRQLVPQIPGHPAAIFALAAVCCASLANFTLA